MKNKVFWLKIWTPLIWNEGPKSWSEMFWLHFYRLPLDFSIIQQILSHLNTNNGLYKLKVLKEPFEFLSSFQ